MQLISEFVLKVHSRCNLACDWCYVYQSVDQSWRDQPRTMSAETAEAIASGIAEYARRQDLPGVRLVLHGGEPLLLGRERMGAMLTRFRDLIAPITELRMTVQTNGVRVDEAWAQFFLDHDVRVGVSLDGGRAANDRHRRFRNGASSYDQVVRGVEVLSQEPYRKIFAGLLCTVDIENDPLDVFSALTALHPPQIDLLLPHATWEYPPPHRSAGTAPYGDWLATVFDAWFYAPPATGIRLFEELLNGLLGGASHSEALGEAIPQSLIIETDGSLEQTDALKVAFPGAAATGYNVADHGLLALAADQEAFSTARRAREMSATCRRCSVVDVCGGGLYPHRYRPENGFANPSVYCDDLMRLITHVATCLQRDLTAHPERRAQADLRVLERVTH